MDRSYLRELERNLLAAAHQAVSESYPVSVGFIEETCSLARDRRKFSANKHVDHRLPVIAFEGEEGKFLAVLANYGMHNVALSSQNRYISADVSGVAAELARQNLPGKPITMITCGACANTVPPLVSADPALMRRYAQIMSHVIVRGANSTRQVEDEVLFSAIEEVDLPLKILSYKQINLAYEKACTRFDMNSAWIEAINAWRDETLRLLDTDPPKSVPTRIQAIRIGPVVFIAFSAEVFSRMAEEIQKACGSSQYVVGCANGNIGYLPYEEIYAEGGYEVDTAYMFYSNFGIARGTHELFRDSAIRMSKAITNKKISPDYRSKPERYLEEYR
jgi:hypothetical protein